MSGEDRQGGGKRKPATSDFTPVSRNRHPRPPPDHSGGRSQKVLGGALFQLPGWDEETASEGKAPAKGHTQSRTGTQDLGLSVGSSLQ